MYLSSWKRITVFDLVPYLKKEKTVYFKEKIEHPQLIDFWNFFIKFKKVRRLNSFLKENPYEDFISLNGNNTLEIALELQYLPLLKTVLSYCNSSMFQIKDESNLTVLDKFWYTKFNIYKEVLKFIKEQQLTYLFYQEHMLLLVNTSVDKMVYFEKLFPGLFLKLYNKKIDNLNPHFQYVILEHDILKSKLNKKLKPKFNKKIIVKI